MRNLKKFLALVLALMMAFSLMVTVNAANADPMSDLEDVTEELQEAVTVLNGMGIITGFENGEFRPQDPIRRVDVSALVYRLVTGDWQDSRSNLYSTYQKFSDVTSTYSWAAGYIGYCANQEIIKGVGGNRYAPESNVTGYQILAMVLRAVGYDQNGEFEGTDWQVRVASTATQLGILDNVNSTSYAGTLGDPATRELVAEIIFQAAQLPMVRYELGYYNPYIGVASAQGSNILNDSLGYKYYGLANQTGIIVGNQATGEDNTKLGIATEPIKDDNSAVVGARATGVSYTYATDSTSAGENLTLEFKTETELDLFGHKATVWYNSRTAQGVEKYADTNVEIDSQYATVYAVLDEAELVKTVFADDRKTADKTDNKTSVYSAAVAAGFSSKSNPQWESDVYSRIAQVTSYDATNKTGTATQSKVGMYTIISNNADKKADLVIPLNLEVAKITQVNTTIKDGEYIYLGESSSKFGIGLATPATPDGKILMDNLAPGSDTKLGDVVTAFQIIGTTDAKANINAADYLYDTRKLTSTVTGTVATYEVGTTDVASTTLGVNSGAEYMITAVTLNDNKTYDLSGITGSKADYGFDTTDSHLIDKAVAPLTTKNIQAGVTYTFYLDAMDRFIGVSAPEENAFLYGTYADYSMGGLGSAEMDYVISGVNWDGAIVSNQDLIRYDAAGNGTFVTLKGHIDATYNVLTVSRKDLGSASTATGNQILPGYNTGYMINEDGDLTTNVTNGSQFFGWWDASLQTPAAVNSWTITSGDATNGFARVKNSPAVPANGNTDKDYLLTDATKFVVVSGVGINATVKVYNGIKDLVGTSSSVEISYDATGTTASKNQVWFQTEEQAYGNVDTSKNNTIKTVILSEENLAQYGAQAMYFAAPGASAATVKLAGCDDANVKQYKLYSNGVEGYYWVKDDAGVAADGETNGNFYTLIQIDTISGQPIYKATKVTDVAGKNNKVNQTYNYVVVNNVNTAEIGSSVYKVGDAVVVEAYGTNDVSTLFPDGTNIKDVLTLNHAVSMGKPGASGNLYTVTVAIVYSGINVSCIYVTNIAAT